MGDFRLPYPILKAPPWFGGQFGVEGSDDPEGFRYAPDARVFYVDEGHALTNDNNAGTDPRAPLTTIGAAVAKAVDGRGDVIVVSPGSYTITSAITMDKALVTLVSMPVGCNPRQPEESVYVWPTAAYVTGPCFIVEKPCAIIGIDIAGRNPTHGGTPATASAGIAVDGEGGSSNGAFCYIKNCRFVDWIGGLDYGIWFYAGAYNRVESCEFEGLANAGILFAPSPSNNPIFNEVVDCTFRNCPNGIEHSNAGTPGDFLYKSNVFIDYTDAIDFNNTAANGLVADNWYETATDAATYDIAVAAAKALGINFSGNHYSE